MEIMEESDEEHELTAASPEKQQTLPSFQETACGVTQLKMFSCWAHCFRLSFKLKASARLMIGWLTNWGCLISAISETGLWKLCARFAIH